MPAAGLAIVTDSSESPSAVCPASTQVPVVQLKTNRSRSAAGSLGLPIVARSDVAPAVTVDLRTAAAARFAIVGVAERAAEGRADRAAGERAEQVRHRVRPGDRHTDGRATRSCRGSARRVAPRIDRRQRERRERRSVRVAPRIDRDLPDAGLRVRRRPAQSGCPSCSRPARGGVVAVRHRVRCRSRRPYGCQRRKRACAGAGRGARPGHVDLERRHVRPARGRSSAPSVARAIVPVIVASSCRPR